MRIQSGSGISKVRVSQKIGNEEGIQLKGNRLANRVIGRIGDASAL